MVASKECCCMDVKICGMIVGVLGVMFGVGAFLSSLAILFTLPWGIFVLATYIIVLVGVIKKSNCCLMTAEVFLGFNIVLQVIGTILCLCLAFGASFISRWFYEQIRRSKNYDNNINFEELHLLVQTITIISVVSVFLMLGGFIYSCIVVHRVRKVIKEENTPAPMAFPRYSPNPPVYVNLHGPNTIPQQQNNSAPSTPQQYHYPPTHLPQANVEQRNMPQHGYPTDTVLYPNINNSDNSSAPQW